MRREGGVSSADGRAKLTGSVGMGPKQPTLNTTREIQIVHEAIIERIEGRWPWANRSSTCGIFHSISKQHLHRYCNEFSFRWNHRGVSDGERTEVAIRSGEGKRLTYV
jgi:hypothetical protein